MKRSEYIDYQESVADFFKREGIHNLSTITDKENGYCEPHFSWSPCHCCNRALGGDRYDCNGYCPKTKEIYEYSVCVDCIYYAQYGTLDDMTMMDMEEDLEETTKENRQ